MRRSDDHRHALRRGAVAMSLLCLALLLVSAGALALLAQGGTREASLLGSVAGAISLILVACALRVGRLDRSVRRELEDVYRVLRERSYRDPVTEAWNLRFLEAEYPGFLETVHASGRDFHFALLELDGLDEGSPNEGDSHEDEILRWISAAFQGEVYSRGHLFRTGDTEFAVALDVDDPQSVIRAAMDAVRRYAAVGGPAAATPPVLYAGIVSAPPELPLELDEAQAIAREGLQRARDEGRSTLWMREPEIRSRREAKRAAEAARSGVASSAR